MPCQLGAGDMQWRRMRGGDMSGRLSALPGYLFDMSHRREPGLVRGEHLRRDRVRIRLHDV